MSSHCLLFLAAASSSLLLSVVFLSGPVQGQDEGKLTLPVPTECEQSKYMYSSTYNSGLKY